ncbi:hypothetical protein AOC36_01995 [Erysipelothrix larvae]|uniref:Uncharacterized protein n=1 Tax=Erysipelothrix larvae TaxID=1514105 RepID=A0A0X8GYL8_9FIRM|nr:hypothetical protein [Erysipelothrix larvae]AMC92797.1 hypothetical protein AOC36_01995 [Erysipelothrix larvae]
MKQSHTENQALTPLSSFSINDYMNHEISLRLTYNECCHIIQSHPYLSYDESGQKLWNIIGILDDLLTLSDAALYHKLSQPIPTDHDVSFVVCHLLEFDVQSHSYHEQTYQEVQGFIYQNTLFYYNEATDSLKSDAYELDWPHRYPHVKVCSITNTQPDSLHPLLRNKLQALRP